MIYLDNASTTQVDEGLKDVIFNYMFRYYGNAGSPHSFGVLSKSALESARKKVADSVHTDTNNVIFTSCGSEANSMAIVGLADYLKKHNLNHIITTKYEHHSVLNSMAKMEKLGFDVTYLDVIGGTIDFAQLVSSVRDDTGLVSVMYVNNELGSVNDVKRIYEFCKSREIFFHADCVQAYGTYRIDMDEIADMITLSGHKIHAPKGVGCLCTKYKGALSNVIFGGEQEFGLRPGTENVASIVALGEMAEKVNKNIEQDYNYIMKLSMIFGGKLVEFCEKNGVAFHFNAPKSNNSPKIISVRFDDVDAETLKIILDTNGVYVSSSSACSSHSVKPSHVLKAIGLSDEEARSTIRISFSSYNTVDEMEMAAKIIVQSVLELKNISFDADNKKEF